MVVFDKGLADAQIARKVEELCKPWTAPPASQETAKIRFSEYVTIPEAANEGRDQSNIVTMTFGFMGEVLNRLESVRRRFHRVCDIDDNVRKKYLSQAAENLKARSRAAQEALDHPSLGESWNQDSLPRLLLTGETGVGKTLVAKYLAQTGLFERRSIPEYLKKEDMLEFDLFGYAAGAYTGGKDEGHLGLLLEFVGGVIFLDEIGDASPAVQAKLLAYFDDYKVRPRGWSGTRPFECPTLIVAATNQDLDQLVEKRQFRADLLSRFTDIEELPPLRDRMESFPFILDCLLQRPSINPDEFIQEIGDKALYELESHGFEGNFRELENLVRGACKKARVNGRRYIVKSDIKG